MKKIDDEKLERCNSYFEQAEFMAKDNYLAEAVQLYLKSISEFPKPRTFFQLANCFFRLKEYQKAIDAYKKWDEIEKSNGNTFYRPCFYIGKCYLEISQFIAAIDNFEISVKIAERTAIENDKQIIDSYLKYARIRSEVILSGSVVMFINRN